MKSFLTILIPLVFSPQIKAITPFPKEIACFNQLSSVLDKLGTVENWAPFPQGVGGKIKNFGTVEVHNFKKETLMVAKTEKSVMKFYWQEPKCEEKVMKSDKKADGFSDLDLAQALAKNPKGGIIYLWSPHMELSLSEVKTLSKMNLPVPFTVILDPKADKELARSIASKNDLPQEYLRPMDSLVLERADATIHYPTTVFYKDGKIIKRIPGYNGTGLVDLTKSVLK